MTVRKLLGFSLAGSLLWAGVAASPAAAISGGDAPPGQASTLVPRPLVESITDVDHRIDGFVLSADGSSLHELSGDTEENTCDVVSRQVTGTTPVLPNMRQSQLVPQVTEAVGPQYALPTWRGYMLITLETGDYREFTLEPRPGEQYAPELSLVRADAAGQVHAMTEAGEYLVLDGAEIVEATQIRERDDFVARSGVSPDGALCFETTWIGTAPYGTNTLVVDMQTGETTFTLVSPDDEGFEALTLDASDASLWGAMENIDDDALITIDLLTGTEHGRTQHAPEAFGPVLIDQSKDWLLAAGNPVQGGSLSPGIERGARQLQCCTTAFAQVPATGDLVYYDLEMGDLGFITAAQITDPEDERLEALETTVEFTSEGVGLAMHTDEAGVAPDTPVGAVWQSSPDGFNWTDIPAETADTLSVVATEESFALQYRRASQDPFWGPGQASAAARIVADGPEITRADDLPDGTAGENYPDEIITATGQPGLSWSSTDLPAALTLDPDTGTLSGTADAAGAFEFTVTVTDVFGSDSRLFHLRVVDGVTPPPGPDPEPGPGPGPEPDPDPDPEPEPTPTPTPGDEVPPFRGRGSPPPAGPAGEPQPR